MVFIANHFVKYLDKNIFTEYFKSEEFQNIKPNLQGEICSTIDTIYSRDMYLMMIKHYFNDLYKSVYSEVLSTKEMCNMLIERLINIATFGTNIATFGTPNVKNSNSASKVKKSVYKSSNKSANKVKKSASKGGKRKTNKIIKKGTKKKSKRNVKK
jgi:hypothetical protein